MGRDSLARKKQVTPKNRYHYWAWLAFEIANRYCCVTKDWARIIKVKLIDRRTAFLLLIEWWINNNKLLEPAKLGARIVARDSKRAVFRAGTRGEDEAKIGVATVWNATQCKFTWKQGVCYTTVAPRSPTSRSSTRDPRAVFDSSSHSAEHIKFSKRFYVATYLFYFL